MASRSDSSWGVRVRSAADGWRGACAAGFFGFDGGDSLVGDFVAGVVAARDQFVFAQDPEAELQVFARAAHQVFEIAQDDPGLIAVGEAFVVEQAQNGLALEDFRLHAARALPVFEQVQAGLVVGGELDVEGGAAGGIAQDFVAPSRLGGRVLRCRFRDCRDDSAGPSDDIRGGWYRRRRGG